MPASGAFNSPWGIRFPWTAGQAPGLPPPFTLSIPLGELDFLGRISTSAN